METMPLGSARRAVREDSVPPLESPQLYLWYLRKHLPVSTGQHLLHWRPADNLHLQYVARKKAATSASVAAAVLSLPRWRSTLALDRRPDGRVVFFTVLIFFHRSGQILTEYKQMVGTVKKQPEAV